MEHLSLQLWDSPSAHALPPVTVALFVFVVAVLLGMSVLFWWWRRRHSPEAASRGLERQGAHELFLKVDYSTGEFSQDLRRGYLRSLTLDRASIVSSDRTLDKGSHLSLCFEATASDELLAPSLVPGKVTRKKSLGGSPESWLFDVRFTSGPEPSRSVVKKYLQRALERPTGRTAE